MPTVTTGFPAASAFFTIGMLWMGFMVLGVLAIRRRDVQAHRRWSCAATMAFCRRHYPLLLPSRKGPRVSFEHSYAASLWLSFLTNMVVIETAFRWPEAVRGASLVRAHNMPAGADHLSVCRDCNDRSIRHGDEIVDPAPDRARRELSVLGRDFGPYSGNRFDSDIHLVINAGVDWKRKTPAPHDCDQSRLDHLTTEPDPRGTPVVPH